jgi:hypothetical protein
MPEVPPKAASPDPAPPTLPVRRAGLSPNSREGTAPTRGNFLPHRHANGTVAKSSEPSAADEKRAANQGLFERFNAIAADVAEAKKEAAKASEGNSITKKKGGLTSLRRPFSKSKAKSAKTEEPGAKTSEKKYPFSDADKKFIEAFAPLPKLATLDEMLAGEKVTVVPLSKYFELPKMMKDWRDRLIASSTPTDAKQVSMEMGDLLLAGDPPGSTAQLKNDRDRIADYIDRHPTLPREQKEALSKAVERLDAIGEAVIDRDSPIWQLNYHADEITKALENQKVPRQFTQADDGEESQFLIEIGIPFNGEDEKSDRTGLANRMARAHDLVRIGLHDSKSWNEIMAANPNDRELLEEYERLRRANIVARVAAEAKTSITFDQAKRTFTIAASDIRAERARYVLRDIAVAMGGVRDPLTLFAYEEDGAATG